MKSSLQLMSERTSISNVSVQLPASPPSIPQVEASFTADGINMLVKLEMVVKDGADIPSTTGVREFTVAHLQRW